ncbi:hypothetical protein CRYUN_Cryun40dG0075000 [Craigia yunnanensis]
MPQHQGARDSARDLLHCRHGLLHRARIPHPIPVQTRPIPPIPPLLERQSRFQSRRETRLPLEEIGVSNIAIDDNEEISRPIHRRRLVLPLFDSLRRVGVEIDGAERLAEIGTS